MLVSLHCGEGWCWQQQFFTLLAHSTWAQQMRYPKTSFHLRQVWPRSPPVNHLTPYILKTNLPDKQENPWGSTWHKSPWARRATMQRATTHVTPSAKHIFPYRLVEKWTQNKCLVNNWYLLPLGCQQWYSRVQWASGAKILPPIFQNNLNLKK